jgi:hypothetical protein
MTHSAPRAADERAPAENSATVCLIAKDEGPYLVEWLAHYVSVGFDRIAVYDNASTDDTAAIVAAASAVFPQIEYTFWPDRPGVAPQIPVYRDALARCRTEWIAYFDADELLVLRQHDSIHSFLARYPAEAGSVAINWLLFGSAGLEAYSDELQSTRFRMAARNSEITKNQFIKSISRVRAVRDPMTHSVVLGDGFATYDADAAPVEVVGPKTRRPAHGVAQLNHYIVRSRGEFLEKKLRGDPTRANEDPSKFSYRDQEFWDSHDTNHEPNDAIDPWIDRSAPARGRILAHLAAARGDQPE